jgi:hypothetical protein
MLISLLPINSPAFAEASAGSDNIGCLPFISLRAATKQVEVVLYGFLQLAFLIWLSVVKKEKVSLSTFASGYAVCYAPGHMPGLNQYSDV